MDDPRTKPKWRPDPDTLSRGNRMLVETNALGKVRVYGIGDQASSSSRRERVGMRTPTIVHLPGETNDFDAQQPL